MSTPQKDSPPVFGKYQELEGYIYYMFTYFTFYFALFTTIYAMITVNLYVLGFYAVVMLLQSRIKRNQKYIDWASNTIQFRRGLKSTQIIYDEEIPKDQKCVFGFHPHGALASCILVFMNYPNGPFEKAVGLASRLMLHIPFVGIFLRLWGIESVNSGSIKKLLSKGVNIGLVPGGFEEATITVQDQLRVFINERKGFIKYALEYNYSLHPVLALNEHKLFWTFRYFQKLRLLLNKIKLPAIIFWNFKYGSFLPRDIDWIIVVGKGIKGRKYGEGEKATHEQIDKAHQQYIQQIKRMHQKHKKLSGVPLKLY